MNEAITSQMKNGSTNMTIMGPRTILEQRKRAPRVA